MCTPRRVHETIHRRRLPLTDPRIHEWSVGYQWAARCYPHALDGALFYLLLFLHFLLLPLPRTCSRSHAIVRAAYDVPATTTKATRRVCTKLRRDHIIFFFLASSASFFSHGRAIRAGKERRSHAGLRPRRCATVRARACVRTCVITRPRRERAGCPGKDFLGDVRKSPRSRSRIRNKTRRAMACFLYHFIVGCTFNMHYSGA